MSNFAYLCWLAAFGLLSFDAGARLVRSFYAPSWRFSARFYLLLASAIGVYLAVEGRP
ncbi:MAG: hypothetical protein AABZ73_01455 [Pseudomonadota bacterium]|uniref:hypothetical protein n=1 Tax=Sphingobium sp. TaxID=1912891 RepID=UPI002E228814